jgi:hypothetical protein
MRMDGFGEVIGIWGMIRGEMRMGKISRIFVIQHDT